MFKPTKISKKYLFETEGRGFFRCLEELFSCKDGKAAEVFCDIAVTADLEDMNRL